MQPHAAAAHSGCPFLAPRLCFAQKKNQLPPKNQWGCTPCPRDAAPLTSVQCGLINREVELLPHLFVLRD